MELKDKLSELECTSYRITPIDQDGGKQQGDP